MQSAGRMGWSEDQFWRSTPAFFFAAYHGHQEQENNRARNAWAQARLIAYYAAAPHLDSKKTFQMSDILVLPGEEAAVNLEFSQVSTEDMERFNREADEIYAKSIKPQ